MTIGEGMGLHLGGGVGIKCGVGGGLPEKRQC